MRISKSRSQFVVFLLVFISTQILITRAFSQTYSIQGTIIDSLSQAPMPGAFVALQGTTYQTTSDNYGRFFMTVDHDKGNDTIVCLFTGYKHYARRIVVNQNIDILVLLQADSKMLDQVKVVEIRPDENVSGTEIGSFKMEMKDIKKLPVLLSEADPLKAIQLMPGIQTSGEGSTGFFVRGGGIDQNLILLDDVSIYNVSHLFGFFSVFNTSALQNINLIKAGMPAKYGGRISSVLDIAVKTGNTQKHEVEGGIGFLAANLTVQGPIKKDTGSFIISGRRTYLDVFKKVVFTPDSKYNTSLFFYDLNAKLYYKVSQKNLLHVNAFMGNDYFTYNDNVNNDFNNSISWGTKLVSLKWTHLFNDKLVSSTTGSFSNYKMNFGAGIYNYKFNLTSENEDLTGKINFKYSPNEKHILNFGADYTFHSFSPNNVSAQSVNSDFYLEKKLQLFSNEAAIYVNDEYLISDKFAMNAGLRYSFFQQIGPFQRYVSDENKQITDTVVSEKNENVKWYSNPEPRISFRYLISKTSSVKIGFSQNYQYIHLAPVSSMSLPTDVWVPSSSVIKPQYGEQYSIGYFKNFNENSLESSVEVYYKSLNNLIEYKEGIVSLASIKTNFDDNFYFGKGEGYGAEFFVKKNSGKFTGWISYTLSWSTRNFDDIEKGRTYYSKNDRRHDLSVVGSYKLNEKWTFSSVFVYKSGNAMTIPVARYLIQGNILNTYSPINSFRLPAYHRMDVSILYTYKKNSTRESVWIFSIYNIYSRQNPYFIYFEITGNLKNYSLQTKPRQVALFPILPSVSWNFKF